MAGCATVRPATSIRCANGTNGPLPLMLAPTIPFGKLTRFQEYGSFLNYVLPSNSAPDAARFFSPTKPVQRLCSLTPRTPPLFRNICRSLVAGARAPQKSRVRPRFDHLEDRLV